MQRRKVLVLDDGLSHTSVAGARALHAAGWDVSSGSPRPSLVARSGFCSSWFEVRAPGTTIDGFTDDLTKAATDDQFDLIIPSTDAEVLALSARRDAIGDAVRLPPDETVRRAMDKWALVEMGAMAGIRVPQTMLVDEHDWRGAFTFPVVVKARLHWDPLVGGTEMRQPVAICASPEEVERSAAVLTAAGTEPMIQELVTGPMSSIPLVLDRDGTLVASGGIRGIRLVRGAYASAATFDVDPDFLERLRVLLANLGWFGIGQIDVIGTGADEAIIDLNTRWFMSMQALETAGGHLAERSAAIMMGDPVSPVPPAVGGVQYRWFEGLLVSTIEHRTPGAVLDAGRGIFDDSVHPYWAAGPKAALGYAWDRMVAGSS